MMAMLSITERPVPYARSTLTTHRRADDRGSFASRRRPASASVYNSASSLITNARPSTATLHPRPSSAALWPRTQPLHNTRGERLTEYSMPRTPSVPEMRNVEEKNLEVQGVRMLPAFRPPVQDHLAGSLMFVRGGPCSPGW